ncbi:hypothetical protein PGT21_007752 [Puccinia graminis f. sp. tritici]|uniref:Uncharacterized protein n=1 Tax=Puccinia graminis f. sp. tritici TaxID=56615 RepID=A0A5B0QEU2_PUCGR|nr:hypothetical protein PGT21_007752 [Puccinia graminis f. sp. tritici]
MQQHEYMGRNIAHMSTKRPQCPFAPTLQNVGDNYEARTIEDYAGARTTFASIEVNHGTALRF